ncbi:MAG: hypothetical protein C4336_08380, partial [Armatimonadota bacterium]
LQAPGFSHGVHDKSALWKEIQDVISAVDANKCRTKVSKEKTMKGELLFSPIDMNAAFKRLLRTKGWQENRISYWVTRSEKLRGARAHPRRQNRCDQNQPHRVGATRTGVPHPANHFHWGGIRSTHRSARTKPCVRNKDAPQLMEGRTSRVSSIN